MQPMKINKAHGSANDIKLYHIAFSEFICLTLGIHMQGDQEPRITSGIALMEASMAKGKKG